MVLILAEGNDEARPEFILEFVPRSPVRARIPRARYRRPATVLVDSLKDRPRTSVARAIYRDAMMSAMGTKQSFAVHSPMSALGQKQTFAPQKAMSALPPIGTAKADFRTGVMSALPPNADVCGALAHVRFGPKADIAPLIRSLRLRERAARAAHQDRAPWQS
jgi:hypothetical protein